MNRALQLAGSCLALAAALAAQLKPVGFAEPKQITWPSGVSGINLAVDLNGDGYSDLVSAGLKGTGLLLSDGKGGYKAPVTLPAAGESVAAGDFNGDGIPDLVLAGAGTNTNQVMLLLGEGGGNFAPGVLVPNITGTLVVAADFNNDGKLDLAVAHPATTPPNIVILLGNGDGTFKAVSEAGMVNNPQKLLTGDFNGDGHPDLLLLGHTTRGGILGEILLGDGQGNFSSAGYVSTSDSLAIAVADVNGDGLSDVLTARASPYGVVVLLSNGDGTFRNAGLRSMPGYVQSIAAVDVNGDSKPDLEVSTQSDSFIIFLGNGDGTFGSGKDYLGGSFPSDIQALFGPSGITGFATGNPVSAASSTQSSVTVLPLSPGGLASPRLITGFPPCGIVTADFNGDGKLDLATASPTGLEVLLGNGNGTFQLPVMQAGFASYCPYAVADVNQDGIPDVLVATQAYPSSLAVFLGNGDGTFQPLGTTPVLTDLGAGGFAVQDVNGDGIPDIVDGALDSTPTMVFLGKGDGTFGSPITQTFILDAPIVFGDFNGDGKIDMALNQYATAGYVVFGNGDGTFGGPKPLNGIAYPLAAADVNGDGILDLIGLSGTPDSAPNNLAVALGRGDGTFHTPITYVLPAGAKYAYSLTVADWNGDGYLDIAVNGPTYVYMFLGNGKGHFVAQNDGLLFYDYPQYVVGDFNGDGKPDVASVGDAVWALRNTSR